VPAIQSNAAMVPPPLPTPSTEMPPGTGEKWMAVSLFSLMTTTAGW
jgi:hypothetical protein